MQYLVTINKVRVPTNAQIFAVGRTPVGWIPKEYDFHWDSDRPGEAKIQIDNMFVMEAWMESTTLLEYFTQARPKQCPKQCLMTAQVDADACTAAAWIQLTREQQQANRDKLRAIAMDSDRLYAHPKLSHLTDFAQIAAAAMRQEELKLADKIGELLGAAAFWFGGLVRLKKQDIEGEIINIHVGDRCVEVDCNLDGTYFSDYWNTAYPSDRSRWTEYQRECYASLTFRVNTEWLISACRGDRPWPGEQGETKAYWEQVQSDRGCNRKCLKLHLRALSSHGKLDCKRFYQYQLCNHLVVNVVVGSQNAAGFQV